VTIRAGVPEGEIGPYLASMMMLERAWVDLSFVAQARITAMI
jgi:hypothetical protein